MLELLLVVCQWHLREWLLAQVVVLRGQQTYSFSASGYTMLAESHLYHAQYPVLTFGNGTSRPGGVQTLPHVA